MLIFLVGYMGAGKTTLGKELSLRLNYDFIDLDNRIEEKQGVSVAEIFQKNGEAYFRKLEHDMLVSLVREKNAVVATGGGTPCFFDNMEIMKQAGVTVYLKVDGDALYERLKVDAAKRPLLKDIAPYKLRAFIAKHLRDRERFYLQSDIIFDPHQANVDKLVNALSP